MRVYILRPLLLPIFYIFHLTFSFGQGTSQIFEIHKAASEPVIDGILDDAIWTRLETPFEFIEFEPENGELSGFETAIDMVYTDKGIYVAARMIDPEPELIQRELGNRDNDGKNADEFGIILDTYNNGQNAFVFNITAAGVQIDSYYSGESRDLNWDAVWKSAISFDGTGWNVEIEIPYYALRFSKKDEQVWGVNFYRKIQRLRKKTFWNPVDNSVRGLVNQSGKLYGLKDLEPPLRLSFSPYITALYEHDGTAGKGKTSLSGGADLKYGINESFTLDVSLIPDFSQVRSDDQVLNLSPFEVRFGENRPFFTENTDIFDRGGLFYTRRIGQSNGTVFTVGEEDEILSTPANAPLINATKLSGRTSKGTGIGFFNGLTRKTYAEVKVPDKALGKVYDPVLGDSTYQSYQVKDVVYDPLTNYNVLVIDQNLKNNSTVGLINTNVTRFEGGRDANVTGADAVIYDASNTFRFSAFAATSRIVEKDDEGKRTIDRGFKYTVGFGKVSGNWQYSISRNVESDNYRINDLGFIRAPNEVSHFGQVSYNVFKPTGVFNRMSYRAYLNHTALYEPSEFVRYNVGINGNNQFTNFWGFSYRLNFIPDGDNDFFESRNELPFVQPWAWNFNLNVYTDSRKPVFFNAYGGRWYRPNWDQDDLFFGTYTRVRVNNKFSLTHDLSRSTSNRDIGWVNVGEDVRTANALDADATIFGARDITNTENNVGLDYIFTDKMGLTMRVRHLWSTVDYSEFFYLNEEGGITPNTYNGETSDEEAAHDINFNAFNIDLNFRWQVAPGSFFTVAWKNASLFSTNDTSANFADNFKQVVEAPHNNSLSLRLTYFIDYVTLKNSI